MTLGTLGEQRHGQLMPTDNILKYSTKQHILFSE